MKTPIRERGVERTPQEKRFGQKAVMFLATQSNAEDEKFWKRKDSRRPLLDAWTGGRGIASHWGVIVVHP